VDEKRLKANILKRYESRIGLSLSNRERLRVKPSDADDREVVIINPGFLNEFFFLGMKNFNFLNFWKNLWRSKFKFLFGLG